MTPDERERMTALVDQIQGEKDPSKFMELVDELNELLAKKAHRIGVDGQARVPLPPISSASSE
jgi:hypothetical protein